MLPLIRCILALAASRCLPVPAPPLPPQRSGSGPHTHTRDHANLFPLHHLVCESLTLCPEKNDCFHIPFCSIDPKPASKLRSG